MTNDALQVHNLFPYTGNDNIYVGNVSELLITCIGNSTIKTNQGHSKLKNALIVPKLKKNLLSVSQLTKDNECVFYFSFDSFSFLLIVLS